MESNTPYCYLYKDVPTIGDLFVSTVVQLPANKGLSTPQIDIDGRKTTVTYSVTNSLGLPAGIRTPDDEQISWNGTEDRTVVVVIKNGAKEKNETSHTADLD